MPVPTLDEKTIQLFRKAVLDWFDKHGRKDLPWQQSPSLYSVWVSEIMLQQTQVRVVIPYYERFMRRFPTVAALASAKQDEVLSYWSGLGYYSRARNLHAAAQQIIDRFDANVPDSVALLEDLPGIGRSTAGAIVSLGKDRYAPILDGNVKRVLTRCFEIEGWPGKSNVLKNLWSLSEALTPETSARTYNQAMMDLGATLCTRSGAACERCPLVKLCSAHSNDSVGRYPEKKPGKSLPVKQCHMLILRDAQGRFLMEKRPQSGIWAGLWSFPEFNNQQSAQEWCRQRIGETAGVFSEMPRRRHTFSHFHLEIIPLQVQMQNPVTGVMDSDSIVWYKRSEINKIGVAAPVTRIIEEAL